MNNNPRNPHEIWYEVVMYIAMTVIFVWAILKILGRL